MNLLITQRRAMLPRPGDALVRTNLEEQAKLLIEQLIVVPQVETEERVGLGEGTAPGDDLGTSPRDQVKCGELVKDPDRIGGTQDRDCTR